MSYAEGSVSELLRKIGAAHKTTKVQREMLETALDVIRSKHARLGRVRAEVQRSSFDSTDIRRSTQQTFFALL